MNGEQIYSNVNAHKTNTEKSILKNCYKMFNSKTYCS